MSTRQYIDRLITPLRARIDSRFAAGFGWLAGADLAARISRIATTIIAARMLTPEDFGLAAIAITTFELIRLFNENGLGAALIKASDDELPSLCRTAHRAAWAVCVTMFLIQAGLGLVLAFSTSRPEAGWMIVALAFVYLCMPFGLVHVWLILRAENMRRIAMVSTAQNLSDNILTASLAIAGLGPWAIVLPKLLTAPIWTMGVMWGRPWRPDLSADFAPLKPLLAFSWPVLSAELISGVRFHADKLIIGAMFGLEGLGVYFFAFNAGIGLSTALSAAFKGTLYPRLCEAGRTGAAISDTFKRLMMSGGLALSVIFILQAAAALIYTPIIFGQKWTFAAPLVALICLSGPARLFAEASALAYRAQGAAKHELIFTVATTVFVLAGLTLGAMASLSAAAIGAAIAGTISATVLYLSLTCAFAQHFPVSALKEARS